MSSDLGNILQLGIWKNSHSKPPPREEGVNQDRPINMSKEER